MYYMCQRMSDGSANSEGKVTVMSRMKPPELECIEDYRQRFVDAEYWRPYVAEVCGRHSLAMRKTLPEVGIPGTYPVFIIDRRWIIKFFGRLFNGGDVFLAELDAHTSALEAGDIPVPALIAHGMLFDGNAEWSWPYMVFEFLPGESLSKVRTRVSFTNMVVIARGLGQIVSRLHSLPVPNGNFLKPNWDGYSSLLDKTRIDCAQRHRQWGDLPGLMVSQIDKFIPPIEKLVPKADTPRFLHGDLTADHVLVENVGPDWRIRALIDFGDAMVGDPLFELIALPLDLFQSDKELLKVFVQTYQPPIHLDETRAQKLMCLCLLHPFNVFSGFFAKHPEAARLTSLADFAMWLWEI
ncbi:aminoglycoside phosphotransferase family protein [Candidatus Poribacteria bacterium]|nr:aminoglycoside phosphotransferase family protein [Candidatus Poribacteria bacterium]